MSAFPVFGHVPACLPFQSHRKASHTQTHFLTLSPCHSVLKHAVRKTWERMTCLHSGHLLKRKVACRAGICSLPEGWTEAWRIMRERDWAIVRHFSLIILVHSGKGCIRQADRIRVGQEGSIILDSETSSPSEILSSSCYSFPPSFTHLHGHTDTHSHLPTLSAHREINR